MSPLVEEGWVLSGRGPGGGYQLTEAAAELRLLEILEATEGPAENGRCVLRGGPCPGAEPCPIHAAWVEARQVLVDRLQAIPVLQT